jgi:hypothetical protein
MKDNGKLLYEDLKKLKRININVDFSDILEEESEYGDYINSSEIDKLIQKYELIYGR